MNHTPKLHWIAILDNKANEVYELCNDDNEKLMTLSFNSFSQTAKFECAASRRVFKIEKEGFLRQKTVLKNEYGVKIGELGSENWFSNNCVIRLNDSQYQYSWLSKNNTPEIVVFKRNKQTPLLTCNFLDSLGQKLFNFTTETKNLKLYSLLTGLCWYVFMPITAEQNKLQAV